jgi:phosphatidylserine/phosphatidylglycerophosphate/cardiolipin synthase-like enzyme
MPNGGIDGGLDQVQRNDRLLGGVNVTLAGFTVEIFERGLFGKTFLGSAQTDAAGDFSVRYPANPIGGRHLLLEIRDEVHRLILADDLGVVNDPIRVQGPYLKLAINCHGWVTTNDDWGPEWLSTGNQVTLLVDNAQAWGDLTTAISAAADTVHLSQLQFELDYMFTLFDPDPPTIGVPTTGTRLEEELVDAGDRDCEVQVLMNDFYIGHGADSWSKVRDYFEDTTVTAKNFKRIPIEGAMHAKVAVIDDETAYAIGSGLLQEYFDGPGHLIDDPRRGEMAMPENQMRTPIHDLSAKVTGNAVQDFESIFQMLWRDLAILNIPPRVADPAGHSVQLTLTLPANELPQQPDGLTGVLESYLRAIRYAQDFVYIENQYFTDDNIVEALVRALQLKPNLQVIMLLNPKVDLPLYGHTSWFPWIKWQDSALERLTSLPPQQSSRVGLFSLWTHELRASGSRIIRNYVHSKVGIVDDKWATVGSANLDGVSLSTSHYAPLYLLSPAIMFLFKKRDLKRMRAIEANAVFYNGIAGQPASDLPDRMRRTLWAEHLGYVNSDHPDLTTRPPGGWLSLWNQIAARKKTALNAVPPTLDSGRILRGPFYTPDTGKISGLTSEETYLKRCDVDPKRHDVIDEVRSFDFTTGNWM